MGVIPAGRKSSSFLTIEDYVDDYWFESPDEGSDEDEDLNSGGQLSPVSGQPVPDGVAAGNLTARRRRKSTGTGGGKKRLSGLQQASNGGQPGTAGRSVKQNIGSRKQRRLENYKQLVANANPDDICDDLSDMLPENASMFTQLFLEKECMRVWSNFMEKSEEEQMQIIDGFKNIDLNEPSTSGSLDVREETFMMVEKDGHSLQTDHASPAQCFQRISARFRNLLLHKHIPLGKLDQFETELKDYFTANPDGVWVAQLPSGYDRLMLHIVSQYLHLVSESTSSSGGDRETQVSNPLPHFSSPPDLLSQFLLRKKTNRAKYSSGHFRERRRGN